MKWKNEAILKSDKSGQYAKAIAFAKSTRWAKTWNWKKSSKSDALTQLQLFYAKNVFKKQWILGKWCHFEKWEKWPVCKRLKPLQNQYYGSKVKIAKKKCQMRLFNPITVVLCKKRLQKTTWMIEKWGSFENWGKWLICKGHSLCKITTLGQKLKLQEKCQKRLFSPTTVVLCKKRL